MKDNFAWSQEDSKEDHFFVVDDDDDEEEEELEDDADEGNSNYDIWLLLLVIPTNS